LVSIMLLSRYVFYAVISLAYSIVYLSSANQIVYRPCVYQQYFRSWFFRYFLTSLLSRI